MAALLQERGYWTIVHDPHGYSDVQKRLVTDIVPEMDTKTKPGQNPTNNIAAVTAALAAEETRKLLTYQDKNAQAAGLLKRSMDRSRLARFKIEDSGKLIWTTLETQRAEQLRRAPSDLLYSLTQLKIDDFSTVDAYLVA